MNILSLFITYPSKADNHTMFKQLTSKLVDEGHNVYVITLQERKYNEPTKLFKENGVNVLRVKTGNFFDTNFIEKGITMLSLGYLFKRAVKKYFSDIKFDLLIHSSPPITYTPLIKYIKKRDNAESYLILRDIFPDNAVDLGVINKGLIYKVFKWMEKKLYSYSDYIGCMSDANIDYVLKHNPEVDKDKMHILRNWSDYKEKIEVDKKAIREKYGYSSDDFIAVFGGNMGKAQGLGFILDVAKEIKNDDIKFLFVGRGIDKVNLKNRVENEKINNVRVFDYVPKSEYEKLIAACNLGIVSLLNQYTIPNIPSKTVDFFKLGLPIIASIDENTDYGDIIENQAEAGLYSIHGDKKEYINNLNKIINNKDLREEMSRNARNYYEEYLTTKTAVDAIMNQVSLGE